MLSENQLERWNAYQAAEERGSRAEMLRALDEFLDSLNGSPEQEWFPWARDLAERIGDGSEPLGLRWPLIERAVFPAVLAGYREKLPGCARLLAGFMDNLRRPGKGQKRLPESDLTELELLHEALRQDPADQRALKRILDIMVDRLRFALHELPAGVLYGMDGASPEQCRELEEELDEFCRLLALAEHGEEEPYKDLIARARFHFRAYHDYRSSTQPYRSYAEYLDQERNARET